MSSRLQALARGTYESVTDFAKIMHYRSITSLLSPRSSYSLRSHHHHYCHLLIFHYLSHFISLCYTSQQQRSINRARKGKKEKKKKMKD
jgi:hypothetical protein